MRTTAQMFKALSDETRLRIMALLMAGGELCVCDIMAVLRLPQSTVSRHLSYLRNARLVTDRRQGVWMYYQVDSSGDEHAAALFALLDEMMQDNDQVLKDRHSLTLHLAGKGESQCG